MDYKIILIALAALSTQAIAQTTYYSNPSGVPIGQAQSMTIPTQPTAPLTPRAPLSPPSMFNQQ